ncbi:MAG: FecCD family ABC transporter permease [Vulcanimicrobiota bacterium]
MSARAFWAISLGMWTLLVVVLALAALVGSVSVPVSTLLSSLISPGGPSTTAHQILWDIRLPRVLLAALVGASLAAVGVALQAVVRNPLADPYILGSSSGASTGAALMMLLGLPALVKPAAFAGALLALMLAQGLARQGRRLAPERLLLAGVAVGYMLAALTSLLTVMGDQRMTRGVLFWLLGGFSGATWSDLLWPSLVLVLGTFFLLLQSRALNALSLGEEASLTLGIEPDRFRKQLLALSAVLTGVCVAVSGAIGFVGMMVPHLARRLVGADHRRLLPVVLAGGAVLMVVADLLARVWLGGRELPVGILTALAGGPFFLWMMAGRQR